MKMYIDIIMKSGDRISIVEENANEMRFRDLTKRIAEVSADVKLSLTLENNEIGYIIPSREISWARIQREEQ